MDNRALRAAKTYVINELRAAEQSELQSLRHLRNAGQEWIKIKEELGGRGLNISDWCKTHMPVSRQWLDRYAELAKGWREFLSARKWAGDVGYMSRRESGLDFALELMTAKHRYDTISSAACLRLIRIRNGHRQSLRRYRGSGSSQAMPWRGYGLCPAPRLMFV
jgi:hypothetical protein